MKEKMLTQHVLEKYSYSWYAKERSGVWDVYWHLGNLPGYTTYDSKRVKKDQLTVLFGSAETLTFPVLKTALLKS